MKQTGPTEWQRHAILTMELAAAHRSIAAAIKDSVAIHGQPWDRYRSILVDIDRSIITLRQKVLAGMGSNKASTDTPSRSATAASS